MDKRLKYRLKQDLSFLKNRIKYKLCRIFYVTQDKMVFFESYHGKRCGDSVKAIYDEMAEDEAFRDYTFVWAFTDPKKHRELAENPRTILVKKGSRDYFRYAAASRFWVNNVSVPDFLIPGKHQVYIETWHGTPLKRLGCDIETDSDPRQSRERMHKRYRNKGKKVTHFLSPSPYYSEKIASAFGLGHPKDNQFIECGYPRNDALFHYSEEDIAQIRERLGIREGQKVILYTPTWRDTDFQTQSGFRYHASVDLEKVMKGLPEDCMLLFRAHHQIGLSGIIENTSQIIDVTDIDNINDLYIISDLMITDYSSTMFDFSVLKRPMVFHMYDREEYANEIRGFYFDLSELPGPITEDETALAQAVTQQLEHFDYSKDPKYQAFHDKFNLWEDGQAARRVVDNCIAIPAHKPGLWERLIRTFKKNMNRIRIVYMIVRYNITGWFNMHGFFLNNNGRRLMDMKDCHKGERCFLIGNGPSLSPEDLHLLKDEYTFGTNMVYKIYDKTDWRPSFHCVSDSIYATKLRDELYNNVKSPLFTIEKTYHKMTKRTLDTTYVHTIASERYKVRGNIFAYCMVKATVLSLAAEFAFHMGFSEIYLLGVDCTNPHAAGGHFTDNYTTKEIAQTDISRIKTRMNKENVTTEQIGEHIIDRSLFVYRLLKKYADRHGIKIYNATRGGNLEVFPRVQLEDVLASEKPGPGTHNKKK